MNRIFRTTLTAAVAFLAGAACTDPTVAPKSTINSETVFTEPSAYKAYLAKLYAGLAVTGQQGAAGNADIGGIDEGFSHYIRLYWQMQELPTDEAAVAWGDQGIQELNSQSWGSANSFLGAMYYRVFFQVAMVNQFMRETSAAKLNQRGVSQALKDEIAQYRAEARFLRALSYYHGLDLFGAIPLVTENSPIQAMPPQATKQQIFDFITDELSEIQSELPAPRTGQYGRADRAAAAMLLAKVYMNAEAYTGSAKYAEALTEVNKVIAGGYTLDGNFRRMFSADNHTSPELVFAVPADGRNIQTWGGMTFLIHASIGGNMNAGDFHMDGGWWGLRTKQAIADLYPAIGPASPDVRSRFFTTDGFNPVMTDLTNFTTGVGAPKYTNKTSTGGNGQDLTFPDTDFPMFRLADAYLMYAEIAKRAPTAGASEAQALTYVNNLRQRAYGNASGNITAGQLTLDFILDERARELFWEGHRRQDLIRFGKYTGAAKVWPWKGNVAAGTGTPDFRKLYPLPASELIANKNLTQNTGY
jgi:hypothetical protein